MDVVLKMRTFDQVRYVILPNYFNVDNDFVVDEDS